MNLASNITRIIIPIIITKKQRCFHEHALEEQQLRLVFFFISQANGFSPQLSTLLVLVPVQVGGASLCYPLNSFSSPSFQIYKYICVFFFNAAGLFSILCTIDSAFFLSDTPPPKLADLRSAALSLAVHFSSSIHGG